jgi:hypothetical protein
VAGRGGVARAGWEGEGLERARVGGGHAVQHEEEELVGERVERRHGGAEAAALGLVVRCHGHGLTWETEARLEMEGAVMAACFLTDLVSIMKYI